MVRPIAEAVGHDLDVVMDGGAYLTLSPVVLSRGVLHPEHAQEKDQP